MGSRGTPSSFVLWPGTRWITERLKSGEHLDLINNTDGWTQQFAKASGNSIALVLGGGAAKSPPQAIIFVLRCLRFFHDDETCKGRHPIYSP